MTKRISKQLNSFKYNGEPIKITIGTLLLTAFCVLLLIMATFTQITFSHFLPPVNENMDSHLGAALFFRLYEHSL